MSGVNAEPSGASGSLASDIDERIVDPATYASPGAADELFAALRRHDPIHWTQPKDHRPFWTISKYEDLKAVEIQSDAFLNAPRLILRSLQQEEAVKALTGGRALLLRNLVNMDGAEHHAFRRLTQAWFMPPMLKSLEADLRTIAGGYVDRLLAFDGRCDFVQDVALWYPLHVIMKILGVPRSDEPLMLRLTQQLFGPDDPDISTAAPADLKATIAAFFDYFGKLTADRRARPGDDVASLIANAVFDGQPIGELEAMSYYIVIATAGHDTTSSTTAGGLLALLQNPAQIAKLRADPALLPSAIDEMLRWVSPVKHFFRTATKDTVLRGRAISAGDSLLMAYPSANRDEEVFDEPFRFDIARSPNRHLAFGYGPHVCLGQHLAKLEIRIFFEELLARVSEIELDGEPRWLQANFVGGLKRLPIRFRPAQ